MARVEGKINGSSPRVRGTLARLEWAGFEDRFIPACAGNTPRRLRPTVSPPVHPRVCGEHAVVGRGHGVQHGSSPRVRGTLFQCSHWRQGHRFIPACAGNTMVGCRMYCPLSVHPRVCGEHEALIEDTQPDGGSSPRVRGTREGKPRGLRRARFIPACAGNTSAALAASRIIPVHPRVCGEHWMERLCGGCAAGSSPRVRGTPLAPPRASRRWRFIPACAGNTVYPTTPTNCEPVHPRVCGEHIIIRMPRENASGSSPRVRGTPCLLSLPGYRSRFIPACAGNTCEASP